jgi:hypothetical protein
MRSLTYLGRFSGFSALDMPINALSMFRPISIKISNFSKSYNYGEIYLQQILETLNAATLAPYRKGLWLGNCDSDGSMFFNATAANLNVN